MLNSSVFRCAVFSCLVACGSEKPEPKLDDVAQQPMNGSSAPSGIALFTNGHAIVIVVGSSAPASPSPGGSLSL